MKNLNRFIWDIAFVIGFIVLFTTVDAFAGIGDLFAGVVGTAASASPLGLILGPIFGAVGQFFAARQELQKFREENRHKENMLDKQLQYQGIQNTHEIDLEEIDLKKEYARIEAAEEETRATGLAVALKGESESMFEQLGIPKDGWMGTCASFMIVFFGLPIHFLRTGLRSILTVVFTYHVLGMIYDASVTPYQKSIVIQVVLASFTGMITFWFMSRRKFGEAVNAKIMSARF